MLQYVIKLRRPSDCNLHILNLNNYFSFSSSNDLFSVKPLNSITKMNEGEIRTLQAATKEIKSVHNTSGPSERSTDERNALLQKENLSTKSVIHACTSKDTSTHVMDGKVNYDFSSRCKSAGNYLNN